MPPPLPVIIMPLPMVSRSVPPVVVPLAKEIVGCLMELIVMFVLTTALDAS